MAFVLRPYQERAIASARGALAQGKRRIMLCAPVGAGKTSCAAALVLGALSKGRRVLFVAHRRELIAQPFCRFVRAGVAPDQIGIIMAGVRLPERRSQQGGALPESDTALWRLFGRRRPGSPVQIASIDTLRGATKPAADLMIIDEAHRTLAKSYLELLEHYPNTVVLGLTATPTRTDGRGLGEVYQELVVVASYAGLVEEGYLVAPRVFSTPKVPDLSRVRTVGGDYDQSELGEACDQKELVGDAVDHYLRRGNGAPAIAFAATVAHSQHIAERFQQASVAAVHLDGETPSAERDRIIEDLAAGSVQVVSNCDVLSEGTDIPIVKCVLSCRPTQSTRLWVQQTGRGSRPCMACEGCRTHRRCERSFVILDHAGNVGRHGLPQDERAWTLEAQPKKRKKADGEPLCWLCAACMAANSLDDEICCECGATRPHHKRRQLTERDGELVEVVALSAEDKIKAWRNVVTDWSEKNATRACPLKPPWCIYRFRELYGQNPPSGCELPSWTHDERLRRRDFETVLHSAGQRAAWAWGARKLAAAVAEESDQRAPEEVEDFA